MDLRKPIFLLLVIFTLTIPVFAEPSFDIAEYSDEIVISEDGKPVLHYQKKPRSLLGQFPRSNYIHPLYNLEGKVITEDFPDDHLHQRGIFWTWHQILQGEKRLGDGWECRDITWDVISAETTPSTGGGILLETEVLWKSKMLTSPEGSMIPFVRENAAITIHPAGKGSRSIDFEIRILALEPGIHLGGSEDEKGYGGFSPRIMLPEDVTFRAINGPVEPQINAVSAGPVVDVTGTFNGSRRGITMIQHPSNPGYPHPGWILRGYGFLGASWPHNDTRTLQPGEYFQLQYRLYVHRGTAEEAGVATAFRQYAEQAGK